MKIFDNENLKLYGNAFLMQNFWSFHGNHEIFPVNIFNNKFNNGWPLSGFAKIV